MRTRAEVQHDLEIVREQRMAVRDALARVREEEAQRRRDVWARRIANPGDPRHNPEARPERIALRQRYEDAGGVYYQQRFVAHQTVAQWWSAPEVRQAVDRLKSDR